MTKKVFALDTAAGIQRDGTVFDAITYSDGRWVRFQRGRPRKIGGYREIVDDLAGPSRGVYLNPQQNFNNVFNGYFGGLQVLPIDNTGIGSGITDMTLTGFTASASNLWQFDTFYDVGGSGNNLLLAHPGQNLLLIDSNVNTSVLGGTITGTSLSTIGLFTSVAASVISGSPIVTFAATDTLIGAGQTVTGTGIPASTSVVSVTTSKETLASVAVTSTSGAFSCTSTAGLFVGQTVTVTGAVTTGTIVNPTILTTVGTFSCTSTIKLYVNQPVTVSGSLTPTALVNVQVTSVTGDLSFNAQTGIFVGQQIAVTGTLTGTATGISTNTTYFVVGAPTSTTLQLSATAGGAPLTTTSGTTTGLTFSAPLQTGIASGTTYFITVTNGTTTFTLSASIGGSAITTTVNSLAGLTFSAPLNIGLTIGDTYYITVTNGGTTFTLSATSGGSPVTTVMNVTTGLTFTTGNYYKVTLDQNATASGTSITLSFDNNVSVSGGVVTLHPYVFVYGNDGLIRNCSAGNANDWVSADANEVSVATGKIVQGLPVRGGSNAPSGLFWSLDSLIRVSYIGGVGTPAQFWRYDLISSQSSILSSQSVIEYDGIYYWCGVDRFLLYNGVVKEIPNTFNQNHFFDNLNYSAREKVWVTKVPRFGEIWWFYPRDSATECTDAVIYNVRENIWYDAGEAVGAQRSAGYFSQVFHYPIAAEWNVNASGGVLTATITNAGSAYTNGTFNNTPLTGGAGTGATANITVAGGIVTTVVINGHGVNYAVGNTLSAALAGGSGFVLTVATLMNFVSLFQNEIGTDKVVGVTALAIESYFETSDLGLVAGGPSQTTLVGDNKWLRLERVEPDFIQSGDMELYVTGRPFAQSADVTSTAYTFSPSTGKIDMREQRRELRLRFVSNAAGGNYQLGRVILDADLGDVRPY